MKFFKKKKLTQEDIPAQWRYPKIYEEEEIETLKEYIREKYGEFENVLCETVSPGIHLDIAVIKPTPKRDYYTFVTMGMGAREMNGPKELYEYHLERAELVIHLPKNWNISGDDEIWYWPIRWLRKLARLPIVDDTWLGHGHVIPTEDPVAEDVLLNHIMIIYDEDKRVSLSKDKHIVFYTLIPLYEEEVEYKLKHKANNLIELFEENEIPYPYVIDKNRKNVCKG